MTRKRILIGTLVAIGALAAVAVFGPLYPSPGPLSLPPQLSYRGEAAPLDYGSLVGRWQVTRGSLAGFRVWERDGIFLHLAVARSDAVQGSVTLTPDGDRTTVSGVTVSVGLASLRSLDSVGADPLNSRDPVVRQLLAVARYPDGTFAADRPVLLPAGLSQGQVAGLTVPGKLTAHGITRDVTASVQAESRGRYLRAVGRIPTSLPDFGVTPPDDPPFTVVQPGLTLEFDLDLQKA